jgi:hypothetical protein
MLERMIILKPIRGSQLTPNNLQEECIRVPKVYDWVFDATYTNSNITLPAECAAAVNLAVSEGRAPLDVVCEVPEVGGFFPIDGTPDSTGNVSCTISSRIERRTVPVNGISTDLAVIQVIFTVRPLVTILDNAGATVCQFRPTIGKSQRLAVCAPEPFTSDNIACRLIELNCNRDFIETAVPDLGLQIALDICYEVQVEADVRLEVLAKFCFPRPNDITLPIGGICPTFEWPIACGSEVFPRPSCDCQAFVDTAALSPLVDIAFGAALFPLDLAAGAYTSELNAEICDNCSLTGSTIEWSVEDLGIGPTGTADQGFTFRATEINTPTCAVVPVTGVVTMNVTGRGIVNFEDAGTGDRDVTFTLTLVENPGAAPDVYAMTLLDLAGAPLVTLGLGAGFVPDEELLVQDCVTFPDVINGELI